MFASPTYYGREERRTFALDGLFFFGAAVNISNLQRAVGSRLETAEISPSITLTALQNVSLFIIFRPKSTMTSPSFLFRMEDFSFYFASFRLDPITDLADDFHQGLACRQYSKQS